MVERKYAMLETTGSIPAFRSIPVGAPARDERSLPERRCERGAEPMPA